MMDVAFFWLRQHLCGLVRLRKRKEKAATQTPTRRRQDLEPQAEDL
jgi:hypothetical protein